MSLSSMVLDAMEADSPLARLRRGLSEQDSVALDNALVGLYHYKDAAPIACSPTPFEALLLLLMEKQSQRIECLEFLLRQNAARMLAK